MFSATPALVLATMWFATMALALGKPHAWTRGLERRAEFEFLSPKYGQSITGSDSGRLNVTWTNTSASDVALSLSLLQGGPGELAQVQLINGSIPNNGSYMWSWYYSDLYHVSSGCNYTLKLSNSEQAATSPYFTIHNENDGDIPNGAACPQADGSVASINITSAGTSSTIGSTPSSSSPSVSAAGVTMQQLIVGIVVGDVITLLLALALILLARRKHWLLASSKQKSGDMRQPHQGMDQWQGDQGITPGEGQAMLPAELSGPRWSRQRPELPS